MKKVSKPLLLILYVILFVTKAYSSGYSFDRMTIPLPHSNVLAINQDKQGFIWLGTRNGLNRYDGIDLLSFFHHDNDSLSLTNNLVNTIQVGIDGVLWIGTYEGLSLFDPKQFKFHNIDYFVKGGSIPTFGSILSIENGDNGIVWIGTIANGLFKVSTKEGRLEQIKANSESLSICDNWVNALKFDKKGRLWVGTKNGLSLIEGDSKVTNFFQNSGNNNSISNNYIRAITEDEEGNIWIATSSMGLHKVVEREGEIYFEQVLFYKDFYSYNPVFDVLSLMPDKNGNIWIGTENGGLFVYNPKINKTEHFLNDPFDPKSISGNSIYTTYQSKDGIIWIGTYNQGVCFYDENKLKFEHFFQNPTKANFLNCNIIKVMKAVNNELIIGTDGGGLTYANIATNQSEHYIKNSDNNSISSNTIMCMLPDGNDKVWLGTWDSGLTIFDRRSRSFKKYNKSIDKNNILEIEHITAFLKDRSGKIWIGTFGHGLNYYVPREDKIYHFNSSDAGNTTLDIENIQCMLQSSSEEILLGTMDGLYVVSDINTKPQIHHYQYNSADSTTLSNNLVVDLFEDSRHQIWIGTIGGGLNLFNAKTGKFRHFSEKEGLPENSVRSIISDKKNKLWISTNLGIASLNPETFEVKAFRSKVLQDVGEFLFGSATIDREGNIYFGGSNGFIKFHPDNLKENRNIPAVYFSDFRLFNKSVKIGEKKSVLSKHISSTESIVLDHNQSVVTIDFVALNYTESNQNQYAYYLEGFEPDWNYSGKNNSATYTNLDPGKYVFKVKASNNDGTWNPVPATLKIRVRSPIWATWWSFAGYIMTLSLIFFFISRSLQKRIEEKQALSAERTQNQNMQELKDRKLQFFTNISHEIRTPLSMIISPLDEVLEMPNLNNDARKKIRYAGENSRLLLKLVNQLLDLRKLDSSKMELFLSRVNINDLINHTVQLHKLKAEEKKIDLILEPLDTEDSFYVDTDKIEKIINNLLSNAIKFSPENSLIFIRISQKISPELLTIEVIDSGIGLEKSQVPLVFERFYQGKTALNKGGTGIGLALSKELSEIHKGELCVDSENGAGSCFRLNIPANTNAYNGLENVIIEGPLPAISTVQELQTDNNDFKLMKYSMVIVEDDVQIRSYLEEEFSKYYKVYTAGNGKVGYEIILKNLPDIIISDILMPEVDGLELCSMVKSNIETSHIPIIILTAKIEIEQQIIGLETGADAYIPKPFNMRYLKVLVKNTLDKRSNMYKSFSQNSIIIPSEFSTNKVDEEFLQKVIHYIETNIENTDLSVDLLAQNMNLSRSQVYRKIKALTDLTANEFIRQIRLKKALNLLSEGTLNISEIAYSVGFSSQSYFTRSFKEFYGKSPSDLRGQQG
jgi:signal transduction histidine kinase/ligand-binding sensor domain-containing protein/DNA-binding response OmpR family regulator